MGYTTDFLMTLRCVIKFHEGMMKHVCSQYNLSLIEANIIAFLHNNPGKDTAKDIVELRMLSKGNVSQAVESLIQKSLLQRAGDAKDRRKVHLTLLPKSAPITQTIKSMQRNFYQELFQGISLEEQKLFLHINRRLMANSQTAMKGRDLL
ncbi:MAG: MarR family transcriptional regulator [Lachnoclostridium edouardi]|uniref:MarR family winged helix-turn-helix transcriptional regulator n=1 Tax=Lachnoclostridium edouardi TaxID=1926283 RepID=UPI0026DBBBBD|nr:MarR family transcriptional regulator [Lachnoclostridium edouardi]MDO4278340.1 MarR family transcriptional regulator [Lachnoclostridium edouardi]